MIGSYAEKSLKDFPDKHLTGFQNLVGCRTLWKIVNENFDQYNLIMECYNVKMIGCLYRERSKDFQDKHQTGIQNLSGVKEKRVKYASLNILFIFLESKL